MLDEAGEKNHGLLRMVEKVLPTLLGRMANSKGVALSEKVLCFFYGKKLNETELYTTI